QRRNHAQDDVSLNHPRTRLKKHGDTQARYHRQRVQRVSNPLPSRQPSPVMKHEFIREKKSRLCAQNSRENHTFSSKIPASVSPGPNASDGTRVPLGTDRSDKIASQMWGSVADDI